MITIGSENLEETLSKEKQEWLKEVGAIDITKFDYLIRTTQHLFSLDYLEKTPLEEIVRRYESIYNMNNESGDDSDS